LREQRPNHALRRFFLRLILAAMRQLEFGHEAIRVKRSTRAFTIAHHCPVAAIEHAWQHP
jgi:hypothetical protein